MKIIKKSNIVMSILFVVIIAEMIGNVTLGVETVRTTDRSPFPAYADNMKSLIKATEENNNGEELFYRSDVSKTITINDPLLYGYNGISLFSSTVNANVSNFTQSIGLASKPSGNRYTYAEISPFANQLFNVKYMYVKNDKKDSVTSKAPENIVTKKIFTEGNSSLYKNLYTSGLGFMVNEETLGYEGNNENPFNSQNEMFNLMTGLDGNLFEPLDMIDVGHSNLKVIRNDYGKYQYNPAEDGDDDSEGILKYNYLVPKDCILYGYVKFTSNLIQDLDISGPKWREEKMKEYGLAEEKPRDIEEKTIRNRITRPYIFCIGEYKKGEIVTLQANIPAEAKSGDATVYVQMFNEELFNKGYEELNDERYELTSFSDTKLEGTINAEKDGLLYVSIPYEAGWTAYVDGEKTEITPVKDAMIALPISAGQHTITFKYIPDGFILGTIISILCLIIFAGLILFDRLNLKLSKNRTSKDKSKVIVTR